MLVELDLYSGRPNPRWQLDSRAAGEFRTMTDSLAAADAARPPLPAPGLGYRGFTVVDGDRTVRVFGGRVELGADQRADPGRTVERWLLDRLPPPLSHLRALVAAAIDG
ncbi:hypothetical protein I5Q34_13325 [Streptomyces sp. AV19]|uniref:hypothetical protein n=1 Tax=Streptomyces sp. AV19 TaxID=2793068 RepID=UPI0018FEAAF3|nr:hypothetical protein [Streptomyces sp. AV19]MBH1935243.1 hypothetical protein [Streptomyces sp. AV19]MDG4532059.1 hypothetical protein [Streptomyces sp. AV19]